MSGLRAYIAGLGVVSPHGIGGEKLVASLSGGAPLPTPELFEPPNKATTRALKADAGELERFVPKRALRRVDHYSRLAMLGAYLALEDAGVEPPLGKRTGLVMTTGYGAIGSGFVFFDSMLDYGDALSSPTYFSASVHNSAAAHVSMFLKATGPNYTTSLFDTTVSASLNTALHMLEGGWADRVLFGAVDEFDPCYGYGLDESAGGKILHGEGAAFFLLSGDENLCRYGAVEPADADVNSEKAFGADNGVDTSALHGVFPSRPALDLAAAAQLVGCGEIASATVADGSDLILVSGAK